MRHLFLVGAKLLGIVYCFWALTILPQIIAGFRMLSATSQVEDPGGIWDWLVSLFFALALNFFIGIILIFYTESVARKLKIPDEPLQSETIFPQSIHIGIVLIGIYTLTSGIPELLESVVELGKTGVLSLGFASQRVLSGVIKVAIGSWLTFSPKSIVSIVSRKQRMET